MCVVHVIIRGANDLSLLCDRLKRPLRPLWFYADSGLAAIPDGYAETLLSSSSSSSSVSSPSTSAATVDSSLPSDDRMEAATAGAAAAGDPAGARCEVVEDEDEGEDEVEGVGFTPIVCLMASETAHPKRNGEFVYGQGAADDEEGWSEGLSATQWWQHMGKILAPDTLEGCQAAAALARNTPVAVLPTPLPPAAAAGAAAAAAGASGVGVGGGGGRMWSEVCDGDGFGLGIAVGSWEAGAGPQVWEDFAAVINCGAAQHPMMTSAAGVAGAGAAGGAGTGAATATTTAAEAEAAAACAGGDAIPADTDNTDGEGSQKDSAAPGPPRARDRARDHRDYLWLDISGGGKQSGAAKTLARCLPDALQFAAQALARHNRNNNPQQQQQQQQPAAGSGGGSSADNDGRSSGGGGGGRRLGLLLHCDETEERSVAVAMAVIAHCFMPAAENQRHANGGGIGRLLFSLPQPQEQEQQEQQGQGPMQEQQRQVGMDKVYLRQLLCRVQEARPGATTPQRAMLQTINRHFLSPPRKS